MADRLVVLDRSLRLLAELVEGNLLEISQALERTRVVIVARSALATHPESTQASLATLVSLLVRSGLTIEIDVPADTVATPLLRAGSLLAGLVRLGDEVLPGSVVAMTGAPSNLALVVGYESELELVVDRAIYLAADGDTASFGSVSGGWSPSGPLVALAAAGLVAGEAVRFAIRHLPPRTRAAADALHPVDHAALTFPALPSGSIDLGRFDMISAGAVTDSVMWTLRARGEVFGVGRVFDDGHYDATNLNRYPQLDAGTADAGSAKAAHLARMAPDGLDIEPIEQRFADEDIAGAAPTIVIGADDVAVRHTAQLAMPAWLGIGATSHAEVRVTEHRPDGPCAGCAHPHPGALPDGPIPTIAPISFWAGFILALRWLRAATGGGRDGADSYATYYPLHRPGVAEVGPCPFHPACPLSPEHRAAAR